jgi:alpha-tubulin suppressor-like RCC1 family protein
MRGGERWIARAGAAIWLAAATAIGVGSVGCNLISGLSNLRIDETSSSGGTGGTGGEGGTSNGGTSAGGGGGNGGTSTGGSSTCSDGAKNGAETDADCGGPDCPKCGAGRGCIESTDCNTEICAGEVGAELCAKATRIAAGNAHVCAVLDMGAVYCWGANDSGQLGTSAGTDSATPVKVAIDKVMDVTAGGIPGAGTAHTCALTASGRVSCWGANDSGQLGKGDTADTSDPTQIDTLNLVSGVAAGGAFTCAFLQGGGLYCWGGNEAGQMGDGGGSAVVAPQSVTDPTGVKGLAAGTRHVCALLTNNTLKCWGDNSRGQVASQMLVGQEKPTLVSGLLDVTSAAAGQDFTCAQGATLVSCWGDNTDSQLTSAVGTDYTESPKTVSLMGVTALALGADGVLDGAEVIPMGGHSCALLDTAKVTCWGNDRSGQLGRGTLSPGGKAAEPAEVDGLDGVAMIAAGTEVSCAILKSGAVRCWGRNDHGQLGTGMTGGTQSSPVAVQWP